MARVPAASLCSDVALTAAPLLGAWIARQIPDALLLGPDEEAEQWVKGIVDSANDPNKQPCANEYCSWCVKKNTCQQVVEPVAQPFGLGPQR